MNHLDNEKLYMYLTTKAVDTGKNWLLDFEQSKGLESWEEWGGCNLIEVKQHENGEWMEVL